MTRNQYGRDGQVVDYLQRDGRGSVNDPGPGSKGVQRQLPVVRGDNFDANRDPRFFDAMDQANDVDFGWLFVPRVQGKQSRRLIHTQSLVKSLAAREQIWLSALMEHFPGLEQERHLRSSCWASFYGAEFPVRSWRAAWCPSHPMRRLCLIRPLQV